MINENKTVKKRNRQIPVLPLKDFVMFPNTLYPLLVGREKSIHAADVAYDKGKQIFLVMQKNPETDDVDEKGLYKTGTVAKILHYLKLPNGLIKILVEGQHRATLNLLIDHQHYFGGRVSHIIEESDLDETSDKWLEHLKVVFKKYIEQHKELPEELFFHLDALKEPERIIDFIALHMPGSAEKKQAVLDELSLKKRLEDVVLLANEALSALEVEREIEDKVRDSLMDNQRQMILHEQMRVIKEELSDEAETEFDELRKKIEKAKMPKEAKEKAVHEYNRLQQIPDFSPEAGVIKNYIEWLTSLPWKKKSKDLLDLKKARQILDEDHFGLKKVKERIIEHLAVLKLSKKKSQGTILCFVGPPGVGKTSLGYSVARTLGKKFVRMSLGGVRDEAEIRGHRRTYVGALPGRIIQGMKKVGTKNPVFLLDEIDKMAMDFRGDPSSALLEVLDPQQNKNFNDHFIEADYDLSEVFFITTANDKNQIPWALQDRMEIIELPGYMDIEKQEIGKRFLFPRQCEKNGLSPNKLKMADRAYMDIINHYTREAGVRNLERVIATLLRKIAVKYLDGEIILPATIDNKDLESLLGAPKYLPSKVDKKGKPGIVNGLAWTAAGGDIIKIEVLQLEAGKEKIQLTGKLGEVMKESAEIALTYVKSLLPEFGLKADYFENKAIHIHLPEGGVPKDGPSAGITIVTGLLSVVLNKAIPGNIAMTGEITLQGNVLPIGGLAEKIMASRRYEMKTVLIPKENKPEWNEVEARLKEGITFKFVENYNEIVKLLFK